MPWKPRRLNPIEKENNQLRSVVIQLREQLRTKQTAVSGLELALRERSERIDALQDRLEQSQAQIRKLDAECEHLVQMVRMS
jgi:chromosome segregation ATPase